MAGTEFIKFDPEKLKETAYQFQGQCAKLKEKSDSIKSQARKVGDYYKGDAADEFMKKVTELDKEAQETQAALEQIAQKLYAVAGIETAVIKEVLGNSDALPSGPSILRI